MSQTDDLKDKIAQVRARVDHVYWSVFLTYGEVADIVAILDAYTDLQRENERLSARAQSMQDQRDMRLEQLLDSGRENGRLTQERARLAKELEAALVALKRFIVDTTIKGEISVGTIEFAEDIIKKAEGTEPEVKL